MNHELYRRLGLDPDASNHQIKTAYRRLVKTCHPDTWPGDEEKAEQFRLLAEAYEILSDPKKKAEYDDTGDIRSSLDADDPRVAALTKLGEAFINTIETMEDVHRDDPLKATIKNLQETKNKLKTMLKEVREEQDKIKVVRSRLKKKAGSDENALFKVLDYRARLLVDTIRDLEEEKASYELMIEIAREYNYETMLSVSGTVGEAGRRRRPDIHRPRALGALLAEAHAQPDAFDEDDMEDED